MSQNRETEKSKTTKHRNIPSPVFVFLFIASLFLFLLVSFLLLEQIDEGSRSYVTDNVDKDRLSIAPSEPTYMRISSIDLSVEFEEPLGINDNGTIEVPENSEKVAWYRYGPTPGETGPSVILGHVDSLEGPAIFYSLGQVKKDDLIEIDREDGSVAIFKVVEMERVDQERFPTQKVYGPVPHAGIRLITCSGNYDNESQRYSHNLIVYGELKMVKMSTGEIKRAEK